MNSLNLLKFKKGIKIMFFTSPPENAYNYLAVLCYNWGQCILLCVNNLKWINFSPQRHDTKGCKNISISEQKQAPNKVSVDEFSNVFILNWFQMFFRLPFQNQLKSIILILTKNKDQLVAVLAYFWFSVKKYQKTNKYWPIFHIFSMLGTSLVNSFLLQLQLAQF